MDPADYDHLPPWRRPTFYNDPPEPETPSRPADVEDAPAASPEFFGVEDEDEFDDDERSVIDDDFAFDEDTD